MTVIKICGIRQVEHAVAAAEVGATYLGLVFVPERRRRVSIEAAQAIGSALSAATGEGAPRLVGLFASQPLSEVAATAAAAGLDLAQLCGDESLEYCNRLRDDTGVDIIKVFHVTGDAVTGDAVTGDAVTGDAVTGDPAEPGPETSERAGAMRDFHAAGHLITLDRMVDGLQGGTGQTFDWDVAARLSGQGHHFLLAGGLTPGNVAQAVAAVRPWGVDVSSGVETNGIQDPDKIRAFVRNARDA